VLLIEGVLRDGLRVASQFTELPWVREQFRRKLGLEIWPGTVNLQVQDPAGLAALVRLRLPPEAADGVPGGVPIEPPGPSASGTDAAPGVTRDAEAPTYCVGYCFPARIGGLPAAVVVPHVPDYPEDKLELVAAVRVRDVLGLRPGDPVVVQVLTQPDAFTPPPLPGVEALSDPGGGAACSPHPLGEERRSPYSASQGEGPR
jgi:hypothetical protein